MAETALSNPRHPSRCKQRSNLLPADWSFTPVTYLCKLPGIHSVAALKQLNDLGECLIFNRHRVYLKSTCISSLIDCPRVEETHLSI
ncbi:hypothetical protein DXU84_15110 [Rahnella sp. RcJ3]|nr:hypothetical protein [Rahnella sp. RcJ3]